jgi:hypothetical protein
MSERVLPPIHRVKQPQVANRATLIRWYAELGYPTKEIAYQLNVRYQQVRNVLVTKPKRAAREDLPSLDFETWDLVDDVQAIMDAELERSLAGLRRERTSKSGPNDEYEDN